MVSPALVLTVHIWGCICNRHMRHNARKCGTAPELSQNILMLFWMSPKTSRNILRTLWNILLKLTLYWLVFYLRLWYLSWVWTIVFDHRVGYNCPNARRKHPSWLSYTNRATLVLSVTFNNVSVKVLKDDGGNPNVVSSGLVEQNWNSSKPMKTKWVEHHSREGSAKVSSKVIFNGYLQMGSHLQV